MKMENVKIPTMKKPRTEKQIAATLKMVKDRKEKKAALTEQLLAEQLSAEQPPSALDSPEKIDLIQNKLEMIRLKKISHMNRIARIWEEEKIKRLSNVPKKNLTLDTMSEIKEEVFETTEDEKKETLAGSNRANDNEEQVVQVQKLDKRKKPRTEKQLAAFARARETRANNL
jgi:hypothetical protein